MSEQTPEPDRGQGISDDQLPDDLKPGEDNPLAQPLDPDDEATKSAEELEMDATQDGKTKQDTRDDTDDDTEDA